MRRKRKVPVPNEEKENDNGVRNTQVTAVGRHHGPMYTIMSNVQLNQTFHKKYIKEMRHLYTKMDHDAFLFTFIRMIKSAMSAEESNEYAHTSLIFCSQFIASFDGPQTHILVIEIFKWLTETISYQPHIRFRLCQFVNMLLNALGPEASLDDAICDQILDYMLQRIRDVSPSVRLQAIFAMQRLQVPDNPDDPVVRAYHYHLSSDPSGRVRQAVITCMGRTYLTVPYLLERLWDIDDKVRRHTYLHMSNYAVRSYKVAQRLTLLEQGLNDRSESVRKVVNNIMLKQWVESYQKDYIAFISALKLDSDEEELERFTKITKQTLKEIFKREDPKNLSNCLSLEEEGEFYRCIAHEKLTIENAIYWQCLSEHFQTTNSEEYDQILPELSIFCLYIEKYCETQKPHWDKFEFMEFQYIVLSLLEILYAFDLSDEIGRGQLQKLITNILKNYNFNAKVVERIVKCTENLILDRTTRLQFFVDIINEACDLYVKLNDRINRLLIDQLLDNFADSDLKYKLSTLKVKILELEEFQSTLTEKGNYEEAQVCNDERVRITGEYFDLLKPLMDKHRSDHAITNHVPRVKSTDTVLKSLQLAFYMVASEQVSKLDPCVCQLYKDFICRYIASQHVQLRDWALKCATAYSLLYEPLAKDAFKQLKRQFHKNNTQIWTTAITAIIDLLDRYGVKSLQGEKNSSKRTGRVLYNTIDCIDDTDDSNESGSEDQESRIVFLLSHMMDKSEELPIRRAISIGFCRLLLRGRIQNRDIIEKLLLNYFDPTIEPELGQILGVFLENVIGRHKVYLLQPSILPIINTVLGAPYDSPLHDIQPETIVRFFIDATRQEALSSGTEVVHNKLALAFLKEMVDNKGSRELCKVLAKDLLLLELQLTNNEGLRNELKALADQLIKSDFDPKTIKNLVNFKNLVDGIFNPPPKRTGDVESENEESNNDVDDGDSVSASSRTISKPPSEVVGIDSDGTEVSASEEMGATSNNEEKETEEFSPNVAVPEADKSPKSPSAIKNKNKTLLEVPAVLDGQSESNATDEIHTPPAIAVDELLRTPAKSSSREPQTHEDDELLRTPAPSTSSMPQLSTFNELFRTPATSTIRQPETTEVDEVLQKSNVNISRRTNTKTVDEPTPSHQITATSTARRNRTDAANALFMTPQCPPAPNGIGSSPRQRFLRRSLNVQQIQQTPTVSNRDGPSLPPKIRIEARIDSDKKKSTQPVEMRKPDTPMKRRGRFRKTLKYGATNFSNQASIAEEETSEISDEKQHSKSVVRTPLRKTPARSKITQKEKPKQKEKETEIDTTDEESEEEPIVESDEWQGEKSQKPRGRPRKEIPNSLRKNKAPDQEISQNQTSPLRKSLRARLEESSSAKSTPANVKRVVEQKDTPDVVPPSPTSINQLNVSVRPIRSTRKQIQILANKTISTASNESPTTKQTESSPKGKTLNFKSATKESQPPRNHSTVQPLPKRLRLNRTTHISPRTPNSTDDNLSSASPRRKQNRDVPSDMQQQQTRSKRKRITKQTPVAENMPSTPSNSVKRSGRLRRPTQKLAENSDTPKNAEGVQRNVTRQKELDRAAVNLTKRIEKSSPLKRKISKPVRSKIPVINSLRQRVPSVISVSSTSSESSNIPMAKQAKLDVTASSKRKSMPHVRIKRVIGTMGRLASRLPRRRNLVN